MSVDPDPERLIYDYVRPTAVPQWVAKSAYGECHFCHSSFLPGHKHNCRLCGQLYCSACSSKYHIPEEYKLKKKKGAVRVCLPCRDSCLQRCGVDFSDNGKATSLSDEGKVVIHPPNWVPENSQDSCFKCREGFQKKTSFLNRNQEKEKKHHCRACGRMFCTDCTSKMALPNAFLKKGKNGPTRVCDMCRYLIVKGAELSEAPVPRMPTDPAKSPPVKLTPDILSVNWEKDDVFVTELTDRTQKKSLVDLHKDLLKARPELEDEDFVFLCRGKPVFKEHWDIFKFKHVSPKLLIRHDDTGRVRSASRAPGLHIPDKKEVKGHVRGLDNVEKTVRKEKKYDLGQALYDYSKPGDSTHLTFYGGDIVTITKRDNDQWWYGKISSGTKKCKGWFPASYVKLIAKDVKAGATTEKVKEPVKKQSTSHTKEAVFSPKKYEKEEKKEEKPAADDDFMNPYAEDPALDPARMSAASLSSMLPPPSDPEPAAASESKPAEPKPAEPAKTTPTHIKQQASDDFIPPPPAPPSDDDEPPQIEEPAKAEPVPSKPEPEPEPEPKRVSPPPGAAERSESGRRIKNVAPPPAPSGRKSPKSVSRVGASKSSSRSDIFKQRAKMFHNK